MKDLVARVDRVIADALIERAEANHRGDTNAPTVTDMAKRVLAAIDLNETSAPKPPSGPTAPCPDADVCQRCPAAADDDVCFPCERLAADLLNVRLKAVRDLQEADLEIHRLRAALRNVRLAAEEVQGRVEMPYTAPDKEMARQPSQAPRPDHKRSESRGRTPE